MWHLFRSVGLCGLLFSAVFVSSCAVMKDYAVVTAAKYEPYRNEPITHQVPAEELIQDVDYLVQTLEAVHPNPFSIMPKASFDNEVRVLKQNLTQALTRREFFLAIAPLLVKLEHDHTHVQFPWDAYNRYLDDGGKVFPLEVAVIDGQLFVKTNYGAGNVRAGSRIQSINGIPSDELTGKLLGYCYGGTLYSRVQKRMVNEFGPLLWLVYGFGDNFIIDVDGNVAVEAGRTQNQIAESKSKARTAEGEHQAIAYSGLGNRVGLLTVPNFHQSDCEAKLRDAFASIKQDEIADLILDVRNNMGGSTAQVKMLLGYVMERPYRTSSCIEQKRSEPFDEFLDALFVWWARPIRRLHPLMRQYYATPQGEVARVEMKEKTPKHDSLRFHGAVYALIGPNNYSSGTEFASVIKDYHRGTIVGQDTGGSPNEYGNPYEFVLPHSHLGVRVATNYSIRPNGDKSPGPLKPDIEVVPTIETLGVGTDEVLAAALAAVEIRRRDSGK